MLRNEVEADGRISGQLREEPIDWDVNYSSSFFLMAEKTSVEGQEEILVFDFDDLINGIGGALGLFLGWSILYLGKSRDNLKYFLNVLFQRRSVTT